MHFTFSWSMANARHELADIKAPMEFYAEVARESERLAWLKRSQNFRCTFDVEEDEEDTVVDEAYDMGYLVGSDTDGEDSGQAPDSGSLANLAQLVLTAKAKLVSSVKYAYL